MMLILFHLPSYAARCAKWMHQIAVTVELAV